MNHQNWQYPPDYRGPAPYPPYPPYPPYGYGPYSPPPGLWRKPIRRNANIIGFGLLVMILLGMLLPSALLWLSEYLADLFMLYSAEAFAVMDISSDIVVAVLMMLTPVAIMQFWIGIPSEIAFPMRKPRKSLVISGVLICMGVSIAGVAISGLLTVLFQKTFGLVPNMPSFPEPAGGFSSVLYFLRLVLIPAVLEEMMFRGVIMQSLRRFGDGFALVCSSVLFALAHNNLLQGPNAMLMGLLLGFFVLRTGSLRTGMTIHFINNALAVAMDFLSREIPYKHLEPFNLLVNAVYVALGLLGAAILLLNHSGTLSLARSQYPMTARGRYAAFFISVMPIIYIAVIVYLTSYSFTAY